MVVLLQRDLELCVSELHGIRVAFACKDLERIDAICRAHELGKNEAPIDLVDVLGLPKYPPDSVRRVIWPKSQRGTPPVLVGPTVSVEVVELGRLFPLPEIVSGLRQRIGVIGVFKDGDAFVLLLDAAYLVRGVNSSYTSEQGDCSPGIPGGVSNKNGTNEA